MEDCLCYQTFQLKEMKAGALTLSLNVKEMYNFGDGFHFHLIATLMLCSKMIWMAFRNMPIKETSRLWNVIPLNRTAPIHFSVAFFL